MTSFIIPSFTPALPEIFVLIMACVALLVSVFTSEARRGLFGYLVVQVALVGAAILSIYGSPTASIYTFDNSFVLDQLAVLLKTSIYLTAFVSFMFARIYIKERAIANAEYYILGLFSVLGMMIIVSAASLLTVFLGLELMSLPLYALVALQRDSAVRTEAAMKYFIIGSLATGILLYGMSMIYGAAGSLNFAGVVQAVHNTASEYNIVLEFGLVFVIVGVVFKLGAVPFHMWLPDVYEGAPSSVTLFLGSASKIAALGMAIRLLVNAMPGLHFDWGQLLIAVAVLSIILGNVAAIAQANIKRMLAYSSIAHVGYMLLGLLVGNAEGYAAATFYMISYAIMTLGGFGLIVLLSQSGFEIEWIRDLRGLNTRNPWLAFMMLLVMFSMAGVPPLVGFMAKLAVLEALIAAHMVWLAVLALVFSIIGAFYYIRVVKVMYFEAPEQGLPVVSYPVDMRIAITVSGLMVLLLGVFPGALFGWCRLVF